MSDALPQQPSSPPAPPREAERLAALHRYNILDTPPEAAFDRITRLATRLFEVPIALISLVDETRAWFKSAVGFEASEVPRTRTLCGFAILSDQPLIVPDARLDARFAQNPLVQAEPGVRFYAGAPLLSRDGFNLGTLCLLDSRPRQPLDPEEQATLVDLAAMVVDELELRLAAQTTLQSQEKYRRLFETIDEGFCICEMLFDAQGQPVDYRFLEVNPAFAQLTGLENALGKTARQLVPNLEDHWVETYGQVVLTGEPVRFEQQSVTMQRWFNVNAFCFGDPQSHQFGILFTNITERKQVEQQRERFFAVSSDLQVITGSNGHFQWVSPAFERVLGWTAAKMIAHPWTEFVHPDDVTASIAEAIRLFAGQDTFQFENRYRHRDGSYRWFFWNAQLYPEEQVLYGAAIDITDRKQAEAALRDSETRYRLLAEAIPQFVWITNATGENEYVNQRFCDYTGLTSEQMQGFGWLSIIHPDDPEMTRQCWLSAVNSGRFYEIEYRFRRADGTYRWFLGQGIPLSDEQAQISQWFGTCTDIEPQKQIEQARLRLLEQEQAARTAAEQANQVKDQFLAILSHELRTPLNPILGWAKLLRSGRLDAAKTAQAIETIDRNAQLQVQLIDDLLDVSRILQGKLRFEIRPVRLRSVIEAALETIRLAAEAKSIAIQSRFSSGDLVVDGDAGRLQQVVWNLLSNAVKFTPAGGRVEVRLEGEGGGDRGDGGDGEGGGDGGDKLAVGTAIACSSEKMPEEKELTPPVLPAVSPASLSPDPLSPDPLSSNVGQSPSLPPPPPLPPPSPTVRLTITDTGKGIHPSFLPHVFEHFRQEDGATTRQFGGLGLGLAIARQIVEMHGGQISVTSPGEDQGATFTVQIPLAASSVQLSAPASAPIQNLSGLKILVVDDEPDSRDFVAFVLEQAGANVTSAASGIEVLQQVEQARFDLVISDIGMPEMDGYQLMQQIRALPSADASAQPIPAIALTAYAGEYDRQQALKAGFQQHLAKPIEPEELVKAISKLLER